MERAATTLWGTRIGAEERRRTLKEYAGELSRLEREALESCKFRGHNMMPFYKVKPGLYRSTCRKCCRDVDVITNPMPNETEISGEAVALNCY